MVKTIKLIREKPYKEFEINAQGIPENRMVFSPVIARCGNIVDGVSLSQGLGGWVIEADDLIAMANLVKKYRREGKR